MNRSTLHKLLLARRLYELARENTSAANDVSLGIGVNLLQDAVELFFLAVSEHLHAGVGDRTRFDQYFELINQKIVPKEIPFRSRLMSLNKLRVNSKHYGLAPAKSEVDGLSLIVRELFEELAESVLGVPFATVSLIDLVRDDDAKESLRKSEASFIRGDFVDCFIGCRKAIFVRFESQFDIAPFGTDYQGSPFLFGKRAPVYARSQEYINQNVRDPMDCIVIDYNALDLELMKSGIDNVVYWNVCRLTPQVYRGTRGEWMVKYEFAKLEEDGIRDRAEYVLDATINLFVAADQKLAVTRSPTWRKYDVEPRRDHIPIYSKADAESGVVATTPAGLKRITVDYIVPALSGSGNFWHVQHYDEDIQLYGYIFEDAVDTS